ncbi:hypothetical protein [Maricaulis maris]|uniref:hypothetical protein n=1 Tax=Maricaulis maris TaxID=74318 RepID=UPI001231F110|nr:hypothetical protein [Maricaulis maris]
MSLFFPVFSYDCQYQTTPSRQGVEASHFSGKLGTELMWKSLKKLFSASDLRKFSVSVGEPWDFSGPDGDNLIVGNEIIDVSRPDNHFLIIGIKPTNFDRHTYDALGLSARDGKEISDDALKLGNEIAVNGEFGSINDGEFEGSGQLQIVGLCKRA